MKRSILAALSTTPKFKIGKISRKTKQKMEFQVDKVGGSHPTDLKTQYICYHLEYKKTTLA